MGSSFNETQALLLAIAFGVFYLIFDAMRFFVNRAGPVKLRSWTADPDVERGGWFHYSPQQFTLITGALLQICLVAAVCFSVLALAAHGLVRAAFTVVVVWCVISIAWKIVIAFIPEELGETMIRLFLPVSRIFYLIFWPLLFPLRSVVNRIETARDGDDDDEEVSDEAVQAFIDVGEEEGILEEGERKLIQSVVDFGDRIAKELMTPRIDVLMFDASGSVALLARTFSESKYSRIPIFEGNVDKIVGIVHVKDLLDAVLAGVEKPVKELARPAYFVSETKRVSDLLREFQMEHLQIAIVVDEYGGTAGIVTIEDVIEQIVGEISDEHEDTEESIVEIAEKVFLVNGPMRIATLEDYLDGDYDLEGEEYETVAGLIFTSTGRVPKVGEVVRKGGLTFEVERADRKRIYRVKVAPDPDYAPDDEDDDE